MSELLMCEKKISSSAPGLSMMTLPECDHPFLCHVTGCWVRTGQPPPPQYGHGPPI
jgi:hypothetical protein